MRCAAPLRLFIEKKGRAFPYLLAKSDDIEHVMEYMRRERICGDHHGRNQWAERTVVCSVFFV